MALLSLSTSSADAGFFDFLFSPPPPMMQQSPPPGYAMRPRVHPRPTFHARKRTRETTVALHHPHHRLTVENARHSGAARAAAHAASGIMEDDSLEEGDAVMTDRGVRIFTGDSGKRHTPDEFAALHETKGLSKRARAALAEIDANRSERGGELQRQSDVVTGRSAAETGLSAGTLITDPRGRSIRYVGP
ncbi:hypothetical protein [Methylocapsa acidiphila]|uniref:hypothetical protein n=1 Tax=Methylocapsa acidiphila TaxID=133552 RepID=UPI0012EBE9BA|nr:hypothetical protein [Methylocapsa acidiphila]